MKVLIVFLFISLLALSCSKEESRYSTTEMWMMANKVDPNVYLVPIPNHEGHRRILCENYGPGCLEGSGRRIMVRKVELIAIEFENTTAAREQALKINQWHAKNWLFDDVTNEPVLESFVKQAFNAVNPAQTNADPE